jgi:hypothetical protein
MHRPIPARQERGDFLFCCGSCDAFASSPVNMFLKIQASERLNAKAGNETLGNVVEVNLGRCKRRVFEHAVGLGGQILVGERAKGDCLGPGGNDRNFYVMRDEVFEENTVRDTKAPEINQVQSFIDLDALAYASLSSPTVK